MFVYMEQGLKVDNKQEEVQTSDNEGLFNLVTNMFLLCLIDELKWHQHNCNERTK